MSDGAGLFSGLKEAAQEGLEKAAKGKMVNSLPGAGLLFGYDFDAGFSLTSTGRWLLVAGAGYGLIRAMGGRR